MNQRTVLLALFALALIFFSGCLQDPTVQVQVFVRDEQGNPVPDAYVYAYSNYSLGSGAGLKRIDLNGTLDASALTDAQGRATLNILPGNYAFQASTSEGLAGVAEKLIVSNNEYVEITVSGQGPVPPGQAVNVSGTSYFHLNSADNLATPLFQTAQSACESVEKSCLGIAYSCPSDSGEQGPWTSTSSFQCDTQTNDYIAPGTQCLVAAECLTTDPNYYLLNPEPNKNQTASQACANIGRTCTQIVYNCFNKGQNDEWNSASELGFNCDSTISNYVADDGSSCYVAAECMQPICGNEICESGENQNNCLVDCRQLNAQISIQTDKENYLIGEKVSLFKDQIASLSKTENTGEKTANFSSVSETLNQNIVKIENGVLRQPKQNSEEYSFGSQETKKTPEFDGYIIEFKEKSIIEKSIELSKQSKTISNKALNDSIQKYSAELSQKQQTAIISLKRMAPKLEIKRQFKLTLNAVAVKQLSDEELQKIKNNSLVKRITPNYIAHTTLMDSVPLIEADKVWQLDKDLGQCADSGKDCLTGKGIKVGVIDTGIDYTHPDFGSCTTQQFLNKQCAKVAGGYDFVNNDNDPMDDQGHGTHVVGIIAANGKTTDGKPFKGMAPDATIYAYKVLGSDGRGSYDGIISAIEKSADPNGDNDASDHLDVINLSLGITCYGYSDDCGPDDPLSTAIDQAVESGITAVVAAGNDGPYDQTIGSPGTARKAITVGATYKKNYTGNYWDDIDPKTDQITAFSSRGLVNWNGKAIQKPDLAAPGAIICSTRWDSVDFSVYNEIYTTCIDDKHVQLAGTSMAAPVTAGAVALLKQAKPGWTPTDIKYALKNNADPINPEDKANEGLVRLNVLRAINSEKPVVAQLEMYNIIAGDYIIVNGGAYGNKFSKYEILISNDGQVWDKVYESATPVMSGELAKIPVGEYLGNIYVKLQVLSSTGEISKDILTVTIKTSSFIGKPEEPVIVRDNYPIRASISGRGLREWRLEAKSPYGYAPGYENWVVLASGSNAVDNQIIYTLDPKDFPDWQYFLRLVVNDTEQDIFDYHNYLDVKNIILDRSIQRSIYNNTDPVSIYADLGVLSLKKIEYGRGLNPVDWKTDKIKIVNSSNETGEFDTAGLATDYYSIRITGEKDGKEAKKSFFIYVDSDIPKGWPVTIKQKKVQGLGQYLPSFSPLIGDIDNDGKKEILTDYVQIIDDQTKLFAFEQNGNSVQGFPAQYPSNTGGYWQPQTIDDLDNDGTNEILKTGYTTYQCGTDICFDELKIIVFSGDGTVKKTISVGTSYREERDFETGGSQISTADVDGDGIKEIIIQTLGFQHSDTKIHALKLDGSEAAGWPVTIYPQPWKIVSRNFGSTEFSVSSADGKPIVAFAIGIVTDISNTIDSRKTIAGMIDNEGNIIFKTEFDGNPYSPPSIVDFDNDGQTDILFALAKLGTEESQLAIANANGDKIIWNGTADERTHSSIALGDIDGDGLKDAVFLTSANGMESLHVIRFDGTEAAGFPKQFSNYSNMSDSPTIYKVGGRTIILVNYLGDDVIINNLHHRMPFAEIFDDAGNLIFEKRIEGSLYSPDVILDNLNNNSEIFMSTSSNEGYYMQGEIPVFKEQKVLYLWKIPENIISGKLEKIWPEFLNNNQRTNNFIEQDEKKLQSKIVNNENQTIVGAFSLKAQSWNGSSWIDEKVLADAEQISIPANSAYDLAAKWEETGAYTATKAGKFRVYASFESNGQKIEDSYDFNVS